MYWSSGPGSPAYRNMAADGFYHQRLSLDNSSGPVQASVNVATSLGDITAYPVFIPNKTETFSYDANGNLLTDGLWEYTWDGENRLVAMQLNAAAGSYLLNASEFWLRLEFAYDAMGRRVSKRLMRSEDNLSQVAIKDATFKWDHSYWQKFVYDTPGWNLSCALHCNAQTGAIIGPDQTFAWGPDLSATEQGAGGIGGLAIYVDDYNDGGGGSGVIGAMFPVYDANGNVIKLFDGHADSGGVPDHIMAQYQYGPFGEDRGRVGPQASRFPFRWSTKYTDEETGLVHYGYRYYSASLGRWISRDPAWPIGGPNALQYVGNQPTARWDALGLYPDDLDFMTDPFAASAGVWTNPVLIRNLVMYAGFDVPGAVFFDLWLAGMGAPFRTNNGYFGDYMKDNPFLAFEVQKQIENDLDHRSASGPVHITFHGEIENGYQTGYEMLHGSNRLVGDSQINGDAIVTQEGEGRRRVSYQVSDEWNDIIKPNFRYSGDFVAILIRAIGGPNVGRDYYIQLKWDAPSEVEQCKVGNEWITRTARGYPFDRTKRSPLYYSNRTWRQDRDRVRDRPRDR